MEKRVAPSTQLGEAITALLESGTPAGEKLTEIGRLGARLVLRRAIDEEVTAFLQRARYERTPQARGSRNGVRPRRIQTAEGEVELAIPQLRDCAERFVPKIIPDTRVAIRTRPLEALIIGAYVRGLSDRALLSYPILVLGVAARPRAAWMPQERSAAPVAECIAGCPDALTSSERIAAPVPSGTSSGLFGGCAVGATGVGALASLQGSVLPFGPRKI